MIQSLTSNVRLASAAVRSCMAAMLAAAAMVCQAQAQPAASEQPTPNGEVTTTTIQVVHDSILLPVNFDTFTRNFKFLLGRYDPDDFVLAGFHPKHGMQRLQAAQGEQGLMLFPGSDDHGVLFATIGQSRKAIRYRLGNPQFALMMTKHNQSAALYAPLTVLIYEIDAKSIRVEYDRPSSLFGQFKVPEIDKIGKTLDGKLTNLINKAAALKPE